MGPNALIQHVDLSRRLTMFRDGQFDADPVVSDVALFRFGVGVWDGVVLEHLDELPRACEAAIIFRATEMALV